VSGSILFLIPARGGSRRIPAKNTRTVAGIPLVGRAVRSAALAARRLPAGDHAVVCSTDNETIADLARAWGAEVPFRRPSALATDTATSVDVALHAVETLAEQGRRFTTLVLVQPTSPLTEPADLVGGVERFQASGRVGVAAVSRAHPTTWHFFADGVRLGRPEADDRSGAPDDLLLTGAFYIVDIDDLRGRRQFVIPGRTVGHEIPPERAIDVDESHQLAEAEALTAARPVRELRVGRHAIGDGPTFIIAEAGVNHDGRVDVAHRLIEAAAAAGADAVKFQTFDPAALAVSGAPLAKYQRASGEAIDDQRVMLERLSLDPGDWPALQAHAHELGLVFLSTPFDAGSAAILDRLDVPAFKVGSGELTNHRFLATLARYGRPLLVSTGMADMVEVAQAIDVIEAAGDPPVGLFHCVSNYPADPAEADLRSMVTLRHAFCVPTGWSDHTLGISLPIAAVALGADLLEKHLTLDPTASGPDHRASLDPAAFRSMVDSMREVDLALGDGTKEPSDAERETARVARRSLVWARSLAAGEAIGDDDLLALRPGTGMSPALQAGLVGHRTARTVNEGHQVEPTDVLPG
jgi:N,N'-diacetyllegionaminate synthase